MVVFLTGCMPSAKVGEILLSCLKLMNRAVKKKKTQQSMFRMMFSTLYLLHLSHHFHRNCVPFPAIHAGLLDVALFQ